MITKFDSSYVGSVDLENPGYLGTPINNRWYSNDVLARANPSPVVELNRAIAVAMRDGPSAGLALIDAILLRGDLRDYHLAHSARADMYRRLGRAKEARAAYKQALSLARQEPVRRFLDRRLRELAE